MWDSLTRPTCKHLLLKHLLAPVTEALDSVSLLAALIHGALSHGLLAASAVLLPGEKRAAAKSISF